MILNAAPPPHMLYKTVCMDITNYDHLMRLINLLIIINLKEDHLQQQAKRLNTNETVGYAVYRLIIT